MPSESTDSSDALAGGRLSIAALFPGARSGGDFLAERAEHQQIEAALRENDERLRLAVEAGKIGTCDWNYPAGEMRWNDTRFRLYGLEPQPRIMRVEEFYAAVHPDDREEVRRRITAGVEGPGEHSEEYRVVWPDGTVRWITETGRVVEWKDRKPRRIISVLFDTTSRHESEAAIRKSEETLRLVLENAREYAIVSTDLDHRVTTWNAGAERLLGYPEQEIMGCDAAIISTPEDRAAGVGEEEVRCALAAGRVAHERWHVRKDGSRFWGSGVLTVMRDANGAAVGFVKVFRDQTAELRHQEELERSREDLQAALHEAERARAQAEAAGQAKDHFLAVLSHELRTPLTPILLALATLSRQRDLPETVRSAHEMIGRNVRLEAHLIDDLLDITRISRGAIEIVRDEMDLHETIRRAVEISSPDIEAKGQRFSCALDAEQARLDGDHSRIEQALWNLLKNASKFTPNAGTICLRTYNEPGQVFVEIVDSGIGIEAEVVERIFNPFEQADPSIARQFGGLGLGLAIAKATLEAHGGEIRAHSPGPGQGATFTVRLPLTTSGPSPSDSLSCRESAAGKAP